MSTCQRGQRGSIVASFAAVLIAGCGAETNEYAPPPPPPVTVAHPITRTVPIYIEENGETEAVQRAEVTARVTGVLESIEFNLEDDVEIGQTLYLIEDDQYEATLGAKVAALATAEAAIEVARGQQEILLVEQDRASTEFDRQQMLKDQDATTQQQYDEAKAASLGANADVVAGEAGITAAEADRDRAEQERVQAALDLGYTEVEALIGGRITATEVKEGNLVDAGTHLATIVDRSQIYANFNISDLDVLRLQQAAIEARGGQQTERPDYSRFRIKLQREIDDGFPFEGRLDYLDEEGVDQATGTFAMRGIFENPDDLIFAGLFVRLRVPIATLEDAILIPESSVSRDPQGMYVQVLNQDGTLSRRNIVSPLVVEAMSPDPTDEDPNATIVKRMVVVEQGISTEDQVVINGGFGIRPEIQVEATVESLEAIEVPQVDLPFLDGDSADQTDDAASE